MLEMLNDSPTTPDSVFPFVGISDDAMTICTWVIVAGLSQAIDVFGVITNVIDIICFTKQGFKEPINISLLGLAVSDLGCLITHFGLNTFYSLAVSTADLTFDPVEVCYLVATMPNFAFTRVNAWITALITLERCLCVTAPLKIKSIVTPKRVSVIIICVYVTFTFSGAPTYAVNRLGLKFVASRNITLLGIVFTAGREQVEGMTFTINSFIMPFLTFIIIIVCTMILVINLQKRTKWRKTSVSASQADLSTRNKKVAKMVVMISTLFIVCFIPISIFMLAVVCVPDMNIGGKLINIGKVVGSLGLLMGSINSSANIFIYYHMSRKYKDTFRQMFCKYTETKLSS